MHEDVVHDSVVFVRHVFFPSFCNSLVDGLLFASISFSPSLPPSLATHP